MFKTISYASACAFGARKTFLEQGVASPRGNDSVGFSRVDQPQMLQILHLYLKAHSTTSRAIFVD